MLEQFRQLLRLGIATRNHVLVRKLSSTRFQGRLAIKPQRCCLHAACAKVCPEGAIVVSDSTWQVDHAKCSSCGLCVKECPEAALSLSLVPAAPAVSRQSLVECVPVGRNADKGD